MKRTLSEKHKLKIKEGMVLASKEGRLKPPARHAIESGLKAAKHPDAIKKAVATRSNILRGRPQRIDAPTGAHADNQFAKEWSLLSPDRKTYIFKNMNQFIRDNSDLFLPCDIVWKNNGCNAARCLRQLSKIDKRTNKPFALSWKGWTEK